LSWPAVVGDEGGDTLRGINPRVRFVGGGGDTGEEEGRRMI
jgi:hypothetical protein